MAIPDRKKAFQAAFKDRVRDIEIASARIGKVTNDRVTILCDDGTSGLIHVATVRGGYEKGEFGAYTSLILYGGPIYRIMEDVGCKPGSFSADMIFRLTSFHLPSREGDYEFRAGVSVDKVTEQMVDDIRRHYVPLIEKFTGRYGEAVDVVLAYKGVDVRSPFCMCVILLGLADAWSRLDELVAHANGNESFDDFHRSTNPEKTVVTPVRNWFKKHGTTGG